MMKRIMLLIAVLLLFAPHVKAQEGDTIFTASLAEVNINDTRTWKNDTARYRYNQLKYYVKSVLPYVNAATKVFREIDAKMEQSGVSKSEKRAYISAREEAMRVQFEDKVKSLNTTQGTLLIKLVARQTGVNIYNILNEFKNPMTAIKWQTWARLNGINLNKKYHPAEEKDLEQIMEDLGYPLPSFYTDQAAASR